jgi:hypothetical protein
MSESNTPEYGENGFIPTVENARQDGATLVLETIDSREETDLISRPGETISRRGDLLAEEQQDQLAQYERN